MADAADFARAHPEFKLTLWRGPGKKPHDFVRVARDDKRRLIERSGLKFPHDVHLKAGLQGPKGKEKLACGDCHQSESSGSGEDFKPITMQSHCQRCHSLEFEPLVSTREAPHGDIERVVAAIRAFYESAALNNLPVDAAPAAPLERGIGTSGAASPGGACASARMGATQDARGRAGFDRGTCVPDLPRSVARDRRHLVESRAGVHFAALDARRPVRPCITHRIAVQRLSQGRKIEALGRRCDAGHRHVPGLPWG